MTHRLSLFKYQSVERQVVMKNKVWAGSLATLAIIAGSQAMAAPSQEGQRLSLNPVISVIEQNLSPLSLSTSVAHSSARYSVPVAAQVNVELNPGDQLRSNGGLTLQINCPGGSKVNLSGAFAVQVLAAENSDCAFNLSQGKLVTEANDTVVVKSDSAVFSTARSVAGVQLTGSVPTLNQRWQVNLGQGTLAYAGSSYRISQNGELALSGGNLTSKTLTTNDHAKSANLLARLRAVTTNGNQADITNNYAATRSHYLRLFGDQSTPVVADNNLNAPGRAMDAQQLSLEGAADIVDLSSLQVDENSPLNQIRKDAWQLPNQGSRIGTSVSTEIQIPDSVGFIPPGATTRDF